MFQLPSFAQHEVFPLSRGQLRVLAAMGISRLTCGDYQFLVMLSACVTALFTVGFVVYYVP